MPEVKKLEMACAQTTPHHDLNYAVIDVTLELVCYWISLIQAVASSKKQTASLYAHVFFDSHPDFCGELSFYEDPGDELLKKVDMCDSWYQVTGRVQMDDIGRVECTTLVVAEDRILWHTHPKHTSDVVETPSLSMEELLQLKELLE